MKQPMSNTLSPFDAKIHRMGRLSTVIVWVFFLLVPAAVCTVFHLKVDLALTFKAAAPIMLIFAITGVCEKLSMSPIIGPGAVYLASSTGNIQNMKLPAALNAMNIMECEEGSEKGRVVSIIAVAASSFVTTLIVFAGMLFLAPLFEPIYNNPFLQPAFKNMMPALFGALLVPQIAKAPKQAVCPILLAIIVRLAVGPAFFSTYQSFIMIGIIIASVAYSLFMHKKNLL